MSHQPAVDPTPLRAGRTAPAFQLVPDYNHLAFKSLKGAYARSCPLALMVGQGKFGPRHVISRFLAELQDDVAVARIASPCADACSFMRKVIEALGFETGDLSLSDLDKILEMFLAFQASHRKRTVICVEETQDNDRWVLDRIRRMVEIEARTKQGLLLVLSGGRGLKSLLHEPPLDAVAVHADSRIALVPFTLAETREHVRRQVEMSENPDIGRAFEFDAITLIHELSAGVPDYVSDLYTTCMELAEQQEVSPVTTEMVVEASNRLELASRTREPESDSISVRLDGSIDRPLRLVATLHGRTIQEPPLDGRNILIGRDELCGLCIPSRLVSRHHAIVFNTSDGAKIADIGSTNGTIVNGDRITEQHLLEDRDVIVIGECRIEVRPAD